MEARLDFKKDLQWNLVRGLDLFFEKAKKILSEFSSFYKDLLLLEARYEEIQKNLLRNTITMEQQSAQISRIRLAALNLIDGMQAEDLLESRNQDNNKRKKFKVGKVLYSIPGKMQMGRKERCVVRIALNEEILLDQYHKLRGIQIESVRVSKVMTSQIKNVNPNSPFEINLLSEEVQFIDKDDYTEWIFYVTPKRAGTYMLALKVSAIEIIDGLERKKTLVLEEQVVITTEALENRPTTMGTNYKELRYSFFVLIPTALPPLVADTGNDAGHMSTEGASAGATTSGGGGLGVFMAKALPYLLFAGSAVLFGYSQMPLNKPDNSKIIKMLQSRIGFLRQEMDSLAKDNAQLAAQLDSLQNHKPEPAIINPGRPVENQTNRLVDRANIPEEVTLDPTPDDYGPARKGGSTDAPPAVDPFSHLPLSDMGRPFFNSPVEIPPPVEPVTPPPLSDIGMPYISGRKAIWRPEFEGSVYGPSKVVLKICINSAGEVIQTDYVFFRSSANDYSLVEKVKKNARKWRFEPSRLDRQCGELIYNFRMQ